MKKQKNYLNEYLKYEAQLIKEFQELRYFCELKAHSNQAFLLLLIELGFISERFIWWYERAKLGMEREDAKEVVRSILRDEIPLQGSTHQDDRLADLMSMGVSKKAILSTQPSCATEKIIRKLFELVVYPQDHYDLRAIIVLRVAGEIVVGETYWFVLREIKRRFGISPFALRFYASHAMHDVVGAGGHADFFEALLKKLIIDKKTLAVATESARRALRVRMMMFKRSNPLQ